MKGNAKVVSELNKALKEELTAINQYFLHAEMCENWGYRKLSEYIKKQSIGEMKHAEKLMERILFLDGTPSMQPLNVKIGKTVREMIESDLALEVAAVKEYNDAVAVAREEGDNGSRELFEILLKDEEEHVDFLEAKCSRSKIWGTSGIFRSRSASRKSSLLNQRPASADSRCGPFYFFQSLHFPSYFTVTLNNCAPLTT